MDRIIRGRFVLEQPAGAGAMGVIWRARDLENETPVAIKLLERQDPTRTLRFEREARLLAELEHPAIVGYVDHGVTSTGEPFLAMEWLEGEDLETRLRRGALSVTETIQLGCRVAEALAAAHRAGIVHRDIKPQNLFLPSGVVTNVKVLDFGIAWVESGVTLTRPGMIVGSPAYMAPEQARGVADVDARTDIFSLGSVLWTCLAGRPPVDGEHVAAVLAKILFEEAPRILEVRADVPRELDACISAMMAKPREKRPARAEKVRDLLLSLEHNASSATLMQARPESDGSAEEQRFLSVVLTGRLGPEKLVARLEGLQKLCADFDGRAEPLLDTRVVVVFTPFGVASDTAFFAAKCAIAIARDLSDTPLALAMDRGRFRGQVPVGKVIDEAAHLAESCPPGRVLVGPSAASLIDSRFQLESHVDGALIVAEKMHQDQARMVMGRRTTFLGRERELATLESLLEDCCSETRARAAFVSAPAGGGKSRLRLEFRRLLEEEGHPATIWSAAADPMRADSPFGLVASLVERTLGLKGESTAEQIERIQARMKRHFSGPDLARVSAFIGELAGIRWPDDHLPLLRSARQDVTVLGQQIREAWEEWVEAETVSAPLLILLDDLHSADQASIDLLDAVLRRCAERPLMILAFGRPGTQEIFGALWPRRNLETITLRELSRKACERLVCDLLDAPAPELVKDLVDRSGGNPFFLEELIRAASVGKTAELPASVLAIVESRIERLSPTARRILRSASVFGDVFWASGVEALVGELDDPLAEWLSSLIEDEWIKQVRPARFAGELEFRFLHAMIREMAYGTLTEEDRSRCHARAAGWLEHARERDASVLALHWRRGGELGRAVHWYHQAASQALEASAFTATIQHAEAALECGARGVLLGQLKLLQAEAYNWRAEHPLGAEVARSAVEALPRGSAAWAQALAQETWALSVLGQGELTEQHLREVLDASPPELEPIHVLAVAAIITSLVNAGRLTHVPAGIDLLMERGRRTAEREPLARAWILDARVFEAWARGMPEVAEQLTIEAFQAFEQAGDRRNAMRTRHNRAAILAELGDPGAVDAIFRAIEESERLGLESTLGEWYMYLCEAFGHLGRYSEAIHWGNKAMAWCEARNHTVLVGLTRVRLARCRLWSGELAASEEDVLAAMSILQETPTYAVAAVATRAQVDLMRGDVSSARRSIERALELSERHASFGFIDAWVQSTYVEVLLATDDPKAEARLHETADHILDRARKLTDPERRASFLNIREHARILELRGRARANAMVRLDLP